MIVKDSNEKNPSNSMSSEDLRDLLKSQNYFAIYLSALEINVEHKVVEHYGLLKSGDEIPFEGFVPVIFDLDDAYTLEILSQFLFTNEVIIHLPKNHPN